MKILTKGGVSKTFWQTIGLSMFGAAVVMHLGYSMALDIVCDRLDEILQAAELNDGWVRIQTESK